MTESSLFPLCLSIIAFIISILALWNALRLLKETRNRNRAWLESKYVDPRKNNLPEGDDFE